MYTGNVWGIALLVAGFLAALTAFQLLTSTLFPGWTERTTATLRRSALVSTLLGGGLLGATVAASLLAFAVFGKLGGPGKFASGLVVAAVSIPLVTGLGAVSRFVGERMPSAVDAASPWRATLRGAVTCSLAFTTPVVGWFFLLPGAFAAGLGAMTLALFAPAPAASPTPAAPSAESAPTA